MPTRGLRRGVRPAVGPDAPRRHASSSRPAAGPAIARARSATRRRASPVPALRPEADRTPVELARWRNRPERPRFRAPGPARPGRAVRPARRRRARRLAAAARPVPGGTAAAAAGRVRRDPRAADPRFVYHGRVVRRERLGRPPLPVLLLHERLPLDVLRGQRPRGRLGAVLHLPRGARRRATSPVWIAAAAHDDKGDDLRRRWDDPRLETRTATRSSTRAPARTPRTSSAASTSAGADPRRAASAARSTCSASLARHAPPARPRRPRRKVARRAERPVRRLRPRRRRRSSGPGSEVEWTPIVDRRRRRLGRRLPRPVGPRHPRPVRRRARAGGAEVHPDRDGPPVVERPARVRRARQGPAAVAGGGRSLGARIGELRGGARDEARTEAAAARGPAAGARSEEVAAIRGAAGLDDTAADTGDVAGRGGDGSPPFGPRTSS